MAFDAVAVTATIGGVAAGLAGGYAAFRKAGPQSSQILVDAAKDVVVIQRDAMDDMRKRLEMVEEEVAVLRHENTRLKDENRKLKLRVKHLEEGNGA